MATVTFDDLCVIINKKEQKVYIGAIVPYNDKLFLHNFTTKQVDNIGLVKNNPLANSKFAKLTKDTYISKDLEEYLVTNDINHIKSSGTDLPDGFYVDLNTRATRKTFSHNQEPIK